LMTGLLLDSRAAMAIGFFLIANMLALYGMDARLPDFGVGLSTPAETLTRCFWISMTTVVSMVFAHFYQQINNLLRMQLRELAFHDPLTRIPNRRSVMEALELSIEVGRRNDRWLTVLLIDL